MPRLKGTEIDAITLQTSFSFSVALTEVMSSGIKVKDILREHIKKGIIDICWKCTEGGFYIVGLESVTADEREGNNVSWVEKYMFTLGIRVRRFAEPMRQEDVAYWAPKFCERILFEFFQLNRVLPISPEVKAEIAASMERIALSTGVITGLGFQPSIITLQTPDKLPQKIDTSPQWEIINLGPSHVEQPDSK